MEATFEITLPGGHLDPSGACHQRARLRAISGRDEEWFRGLAGSLTPPMRATELLTRCVRAIGRERGSRELIRDLSVGDREYLLLALRAISFGDKLSLVLRCPREACAAKMDLDLSIQEIGLETREMRPAYRVTMVEPVVLEVDFRLPSGRDQEHLAEVESTSGDDGLLDVLLAACVQRVATPGSDADLGLAALVPAGRRALAEAIDRHAPRADLELELVCPECAHTFPTAVDPAQLLFEEIGRGAGSLDREVHQLAFHYHWPLGEILALTRVQRARYLRLLHEELDGMAR